MALAALEQQGGRWVSARAALARAAAAAGESHPLAGEIEVRRALCLAAEGRLREAGVALEAAERAAIDGDAGDIADQARAAQALVRAARGELAGACAGLDEVAAARQARGDELGALAARVEVGELLVRRGELQAAAEQSAAAAAAAARLGLAALAARAELAGAAVDLGAWRIEAAARAARRVEEGGLAQIDTRVAQALSAVRERLVALDAARDADDRPAGDGAAAAAAAGQGAATAGATTPAGAAGAAGRLRAELWCAAARGQTRTALAAARELVRCAERAGHAADLADGLAWCGRLELAGGGRAAAQLAAARAAREAAAAGATWARVTALLVLAAVAREAGEQMAASSYARDAASLAAEVGMPVERLVAERALAVIADDGDSRFGDLTGAAATLTEQGRHAAARVLADLGLTAVRPFRVIGADGHESRVCDASPERLRVAERGLVVDGVRELILRGGETVADLRRRSLLKRLLFLFAAAPGRTFSKEEIVETVWAVDYHPLRHDAALFTNIMRIRRLLGADGADLIRVSEEGYRFTPGSDFLFVAAAGG